MNTLEPPLPETPAGTPVDEIQASLRRIERHDWWLWCAAVVVMLLLTVAVISLSVPWIQKEESSFFQFHLQLAVRGLVGLVLLFNIYGIYQQILIKRLRRQLVQQMEMTAKFLTRAEEFRKLATLDPLTGLYNRRFAEQRLAAEVARCQRQGHALTLLLLDLNEFKQINDRYGHSGGDLVLKRFAESLNEVLRVSDLAVRMGGDEFMVLLPDCRPEELPYLLARLSPLEVDLRGQKIHVTFAAGWVGYQSGELPEHLLERADQALYADKQTGKDRADSPSAAHKS